MRLNFRLATGIITNICKNTHRKNRTPRDPSEGNDQQNRLGSRPLCRAHAWVSRTTTTTKDSKRPSGVSFMLQRSRARDARMPTCPPALTCVCQSPTRTRQHLETQTNTCGMADSNDGPGNQEGRENIPLKRLKNRGYIPLRFFPRTIPKHFLRHPLWDLVVEILSRACWLS